MINAYLEQDCSYTPEDYGYVHSDELPNLEAVTDHVKGIVEALYTRNFDRIESNLEEVCAHLNIEFTPIVMK